MCQNILFGIKYTTGLKKIKIVDSDFLVGFSYYCADLRKQPPEKPKHNSKQ